MITEILARRPDLYVLARNPFTLSLLIEYVNAHHGNFPTGQAEMYASFIDRELSAIRGEIQAARLDNNVIKGIAARIALYMFESTQHGLEVGLEDLHTHVCKDPISKLALPIFSRSRLARISVDTYSFSFVHRRFQEFF